MDYQALLHDAMPLKWQQAAHPTLVMHDLDAAEV